MSFNEKMEALEREVDACASLNSMVAAATMAECYRVSMRGFTESQAEYWTKRLADMRASHESQEAAQ